MLRKQITSSLDLDKGSYLSIITGNIKINDNFLKIKQNNKFLGGFVDKNLNWRKHLATIT